jgi:hypothetical protein
MVVAVGVSLEQVINYRNRREMMVISLDCYCPQMVMVVVVFGVSLQQVKYYHDCRAMEVILDWFFSQMVVVVVVVGVSLQQVKYYHNCQAMVVISVDCYCPQMVVVVVVFGVHLALEQGANQTDQLAHNYHCRTMLIHLKNPHTYPHIILYFWVMEEAPDANTEDVEEVSDIQVAGAEVHKTKIQPAEEVSAILMAGAGVHNSQV